MSSEAMVRWGVVGCGNVAHRFASSLQHVENAALAGVWSRRAAPAQQFCEEFGGVAFTSLRTMLEAEDIEAIYVATLPDSHAEYSIAALEAGKAVLCEKPAAETKEKLQAILSVAESKGVLWMEAMKPLFYPLFQKLKVHLDADPIGRVQFVRTGCSLANVPPEHPSFKKENAGGALLGIGVYGAFLATEWLGPVTSVQALGRYGETGVDIFVCCQCTHNSSSSQIFCGLDLHGPGEALLCGTLGNVTIDEPWWNPTRAVVRYADGRSVVLESTFLHGGLYHELQHFCGLVRTNRTESKVMPHRRSREVMDLLDAARKVLRESQVDSLATIVEAAVAAADAEHSRVLLANRAETERFAHKAVTVAEQLAAQKIAASKQIAELQDQLVTQKSAAEQRMEALEEQVRYYRETLREVKEDQEGA